MRYIALASLPLGTTSAETTQHGESTVWGPFKQGKSISTMELRSVSGNQTSSAELPLGGSDR